MTAKQIAGIVIAAAVLLAAYAGVPQAAPIPSKVEKTLPETELARPAVDPVKLADSGALRETDARNRAASKNNLKQFGLAVLYYHDSNGRLPVDVVGKDGKPLLSWRVLLLPHLDQEKLYKQFKLDEPWDSKHNIKLLDQMPKVFQSPRVTLKRKGYTVYQVFSGEEAVFRPGKAALTIFDIIDGLSNTILAVESTAAVPWSKPADIPFDAKKALPEFGKAFGKQPLGVLLDGSVRVLNLKKISAETLKNAIRPDEGNVLGTDWDE